MLQTKSFHAEIEKAASTDYDAAFIMSATAKDRDDDTFAAEALQAVADKTKKLIALWQHKSDQPIGYWEKVTFDGKKLKGYIKFASTRLADLAKQLINDDVPLGASIGFRVHDYDENKHGGLHFKEVDLFECSIVSVPAHQQAYQVAKNLGFDPDDAKSLFGDQKAEDISGDSASTDSDPVTPNPTIKRAKLAILAANRLMRD